MVTANTINLLKSSSSYGIHQFPNSFVIWTEMRIRSEQRKVVQRITKFQRKVKGGKRAPRAFPQAYPSSFLFVVNFL